MYEKKKNNALALWHISTVKMLAVEVEKPSSIRQKTNILLLNVWSRMNQIRVKAVRWNRQCN